MAAQRISVIAALFFIRGLVADAAPVTFELETHIATVSGNPFGFDNSVRLEGVSAIVTYETTTADVNSSATRGNYPHTFGGVFFADVLGIEISGSATPYVQIEDLNPDTFRYIDGPRTIGPAGGIMSVDGIANPDVELLLAFTDSSGVAFADDSLPNPLPFAVPPLSEPSPSFFPHTISLSDGNGTLLLQLDSIQTAPRPPGNPNPSVPEPASLMAWLIGSIACLLLSYRSLRR